MAFAQRHSQAAHLEESRNLVNPVDTYVRWVVRQSCYQYTTSMLWIHLMPSGNSASKNGFNAI